MHQLRELLRGDTDHTPLDVAALQLATIEYPEVSVEPFLTLLDSYAAEVAERIPRDAGGEEFVQILNEYLFDELGFLGNTEDYYTPANSCLNEVLTKRVGIPITLCLVYIEISRRLGRTVTGIGLPGHFLVHIEDGTFSAYIDPFHAGRVLYEDECYDLAREITGLDLSNDSQALQPVSNRHILVRMLNNLRAVYYRQQNPGKAVQVLDLLIEAMPESAEEYKQRGICLAQMEQLVEARADLETYLRLAPDAADRENIQSHVDRIQKILSSVT